MILEGNERGYGAELAQHLLNARDNEHVTVHSIDGFASDDLYGAFAEVEAISQATQCQKYLFSLSLNPPINETVPVDIFEKAIRDIEHKLGLVGQPRAIVFHEKEGRRHAHCIWSRIDGVKLKAINLPHYKRKLFGISQELYPEHGWNMPDGFRNKKERDPLNYTRQEHGQAKRTKRDPKLTKAMFRQCWEASDTRSSFEAALFENGFILARGERRGFVAIDANGKVWSLSRWCSVKPKLLRVKLGSEELLPSIDEALTSQPIHLSSPKTEETNPSFTFNKTQTISRQREERKALLKFQEQRRITLLKKRQQSLPRSWGLQSIFMRITGLHKTMLEDFDAESADLQKQDNQEQQALIERHLSERRLLGHEAYLTPLRSDNDQKLILPTAELPFTKSELLNDPALILNHISKTKAKFYRTDILRELVKRVDDPFELQEAIDKALQSSQLVKFDRPESRSPAFTTLDYQQVEKRLFKATNAMCRAHGYGVSKTNITQAVRSQNINMKHQFGGRLSNEQTKALSHVLNEYQLVNVVGFAGAGKSTLLATAMQAWALQGVTVHGAALAGKAADGLETASGIQSRTIASLQTFWDNGYEPIKKGDVLVVDEAGMIGTRQMARITAKMQEIGAKLVLIGDPDQLQPIEAGKPFRNILKTHDSAKLTEIYRQREEWQKVASKELAHGEIAKAIDRYDMHGTVKRHKTSNETLEALVEAYAMDFAANGEETTRLAFAHRRKDVHALNQAIRLALRQTERPALETLFKTDTGKRVFASGDRIVFTRNDKELGIKNGMLGSVKMIANGKIKVLLDGDEGRSITFDTGQYQSFDHGYAVTIHKSQGATVDRSYVLASRSMDRHLAYVAMTRHRDTMQLYINQKDQFRWADIPHRDQIHHNLAKRHSPSIG
jgi:Ti-type conjugative transfer relaxase TraA